MHKPFSWSNNTEIETLINYFSLYLRTQKKSRIFFSRHFFVLIRYSINEKWKKSFACLCLTLSQIKSILHSSQCLKITEKVSFKIGTKRATFTFWVDKNAKKGNFGEFFEDLKKVSFNIASEASYVYILGDKS